MSLHVAVRGAGAPVILLHGWGFNGAVWEALAPPPGRRFLCPDLPGHGRSPAPPGPYTLEALVAALAPLLAPGCVVLGWSLGGLAALGLALAHPRRVGRLVLVAAPPRFTRGPHWPQGMDPALLQAFAAELAADFEATLRRFLALQCLGGEAPRETARRLRRAVLAQGAPPPEILAGGLDILAGTDLLEDLPRLPCPSLWVGGERDPLVAPAALEAAAAASPEGRAVLLRGAAHAPFLSHPGPFREALEGWW